MPSESHVDPYAIDPRSDDRVEQPPQGMFTPVPEEWDRPVFAMRGTETHGVTPLNGSEVRPEDYSGATAPWEPPVEPPEPVAVRIVQSGPKSYSQWRAIQTFAGPSPAMVVNRKEDRNSLTLQNIGTVAVWVGPDSNVSKFSGYRLAAGATFSLDGEAEVWAISDDGTQQQLCAYFEFVTEVPE